MASEVTKVPPPPMPTVIVAKVNPATIGPQFRQAGVQDLVGFTNGDVTVDPAATTDQLAAVQRIIAAHDPDMPAPVPVPASIAMYRAKIILGTTPMPDGSGVMILAAANALIAAMPAGVNKLVAQTAFADAPELYRNSATMKFVQTGLNLSDALVDSMFVKAAALQI